MLGAVGFLAAQRLRRPNGALSNVWMQTLCWLKQGYPWRNLSMQLSHPTECALSWTYCSTICLAMPMCTSTTAKPAFGMRPARPHPISVTLVQKFGSATIHPRQTSKGSAFSASPSGTQLTSKHSCNKFRLNTRNFSTRSPHLKTCKPPGCSSCFVLAPVPTTYCEIYHRPQRPLLYPHRAAPNQHAPRSSTCPRAPASSPRRFGSDIRHLPSTCRILGILGRHLGPMLSPPSSNKRQI